MGSSPRPHSVSLIPSGRVSHSILACVAKWVVGLHGPEEVPAWSTASPRMAATSPGPRRCRRGSERSEPPDEPRRGPPTRSPPLAAASITRTANAPSSRSVTDGDTASMAMAPYAAIPSRQSMWVSLSAALAAASSSANVIVRASSGTARSSGPRPVPSSLPPWKKPVQQAVTSPAAAGTAGAGVRVPVEWCKLAASHPHLSGDGPSSPDTPAQRTIRSAVVPGQRA